MDSEPLPLLPRAKRTEAEVRDPVHVDDVELVVDDVEDVDDVELDVVLVVESARHVTTLTFFRLSP
jgi:hypothetical protein